MVKFRRRCRKMKHLMVLVLGLIFVFCLPSYAADKPAAVTTKIEPVKEAPVKAISSRIVRMRATGKVTEISDTAVKIDRSVKGNVEIMEFTLDKPAAAIKVGDNVNVSYITNNGGNVAVRVYPIKKYTKKPKKGGDAKEAKKSPGKTNPAPESPAVKK
jgi:hypothetical protein